MRIIPPNHTPNHTPESYPRIIPQKIIIVNVSFGIVWDCIGLACYNEPDKLIDQCWPDPVIPGYLHIPSRSGESSPRAQSLIIIPKLAGSGWLAGWYILYRYMVTYYYYCYYYILHIPSGYD